ncbi:hypothetical protein J8L98_24610, partial [Pseudoalteromonas sp. MMG013]|uniref:hypothetical protein n=1 Tax=Pseudoalteromonas sp. MMG013 TaxID=2822687 RepID=UPI001B36BEB8
LFNNQVWNKDDLRNVSTSSGFTYAVAGRLDKYTYTDNSGSTNLIQDFKKTYIGREGYLEKTSSGTPKAGHEGSINLMKAETTSSYDANGNRTRIEEHVTDARYTPEDHGADVNARYMRFDAEGKLLSKVTGTQSRLLRDSDRTGTRNVIDPSNG